MLAAPKHGGEGERAQDQAAHPASSIPIPDALPRALLVAHVAALALLLDAKHAPKCGWAEPAWMVLLFLALPLAGVAVLDGKRRSLTVSIAATAAATTVATALYRKLTGAGRTWVIDDPFRLIVPATAALALSVLAILVGRPNLDRWGLGIGDWRWWGPRVGALLLVAFPFVALAGWMFPDLLAFYPQDAWAKASVGGLLASHLGRGFYLVAWELFFRGFLTFGMARTVGVGAGLIVPAFPFMLLHRGKPEPEMASSFLGGILLSGFCLRAGSAWPAVLVHWGLNFAMDVVGFCW